jgi:uncharacterized protein YndB with AHSA1/START domain
MPDPRPAPLQPSSASSSSLPVVHSRLLHRTWIDHSFDVAAPPARVFALMSDLDAWPRWVPDMASIWRRQRPVGIGTSFAMVLAFPWLRRVVLPCTVSRWEPELLEWGGGFPGSIVRHRFELQALPSGDTRVRHLEYATGLLALLFRPFEPFAHRFDSGWSQALSAALAR